MKETAHCASQCSTNRSPSSAARTGVSIRDTIALAQHCEALGYDRFWVSEHHSNDTIVGTAPEILMAAIATVTKRIRVGSAGIMLPHYAPFKVAEQFRVLDAIAPGPHRPGARARTGLRRPHGIRAESARQRAAGAVSRRCARPDGLGDGLGAARWAPIQAVHAYPSGATAPEIWVLGSSDYGAQVAAHFGLPLRLRVVLRGWRQRRTGAQDLPRALQAKSAAIPSRIRRCASGRSRPIHRRRRTITSARVRASGCSATAGFLRALEPPEAALAHSYTEAETARMAHYRDSAFVGTAAHVAERIEELAKRLNVQEMAVVTWATDETVRRRSYQLLAETMGFAPR